MPGATQRHEAILWIMAKYNFQEESVATQGQKKLDREHVGKQVAYLPRRSGTGRGTSICYPVPRQSRCSSGGTEVCCPTWASHPPCPQVGPSPRPVPCRAVTLGMAERCDCRMGTLQHTSPASLLESAGLRKPEQSAPPYNVSPSI